MEPPTTSPLKSFGEKSMVRPCAGGFAPPKPFLWTVPEREVVGIEGGQALAQQWGL